MEEAAMATIHSQPHLTPQSYNDMEDNDGSSSSGELLRGDGGTTSSAGGRSLRRRSHGDVGAGGALLPHSSKPAPPRHAVNGGVVVETIDEHAAAANAANFHVWTTDERAAKAYLHVSATPGYVSMEDVTGGAALYRDGSGRPLERCISDPLLRTTSRLRLREDGRARGHCRQRSPGPLGTRRGSAMHAIVKKYIHPLPGLLARIFLCCIKPRDRS